MNLKKLIACSLFILCLLALTGCVSVSPAEMANADFGASPSSYQDDIKNLMSNILKDPYTAVYTFSTPQKGVAQDGLLRGGKKYYGWIVPTQINGKNSYGGYVGNRQYYFFFANGRVMDVTANMGQMVRFVD